MAAVRPLTLALLVSASTLAVGVGCGSSGRTRAPDEVDETAKAGASASAEAAMPDEPPVPEGSVSRIGMDRVLLRGPGWLLRQVGIDDVIRANKFVGWRVDRLPTSWDSGGLQPGDIVTKVNGASLENQDDFWNAFVKLTEASELRITFERDGKPGETVIPIVGAPDPETKRSLDSGVAAPPRPTTVRERPNRQGTRTIIITGEQRPDDE